MDLPAGAVWDEPLGIIAISAARVAVTLAGHLGMPLAALAHPSGYSIEVINEKEKPDFHVTEGRSSKHTKHTGSRKPFPMGTAETNAQTRLIKPDERSRVLCASE
jgi:hypothetical protein